MNYKNKEDLLENIIKLVQQSSGGKFGAFNKTAAVTEVGNIQQKEEAFNYLLTGPKGLQKLSYAMTGPLKELLDYHGVGRRLLKVDPIPQGEVPIYDKDIPEFASVSIGALGQPAVVETRAKRILFPTMSLAKNAKVPYEEIQVRRYPVFDRAKERVAISMAIAEDREIFKLLGTASDPSICPNSPVVSATINRSALASAYGILANNQLQPAQVVMSPLKYADVLKLNSIDLDQVTLNATTQTGSIGVFFGLQLLVSTKLPNPSKVFVTTTPDKLGRIPVRKELEVKIFDFAPKMAFNVLGWEMIGFGIHNTYGVVAINPS